jgi:hypothetical protein
MLPRSQLNRRELWHRMAPTAGATIALYKWRRRPRGSSEKWCGVDWGDADPMTCPANTKPQILRRLRTGQTAAAATRPHMHHYYGWIVEE